ncbi:Os01g0278683 [Oryza sativa Japonica Group]|uniref:Os01g0278683 protein n=1 Tax=Oryza sativa subsp. japonica TaxID=39947 RepID=A0A0P0V1N3_ORYSJ|nr:Os01g0278683 [Oryza sativa Japonica Group]
MDRVSPPEDGDGRPIAMEGQAVEDLAASALAARGLVTAPGGLGAPADALAVAANGHICELLGVIEEDTTNIPAQGFDCRMYEHGHDSELGQNNDGAAIPTSDEVPVQFWGICSWQLQQVQERLAAYQPSQASQCSSHGQAAAGQPSQSQAAASQPDDRLAAWEHAN